MIRVHQVDKRHRRGEIEVLALAEVSFTIEAGAFVAIVGPSGSGKSTLLNLLGALDVPSRGEIWIDGQPLHALDDAARTRLRRERLAFVFQLFNLLPTMTALENVILPGLLAGRPRKALVAKAEALLERVGLAARRGHRPSELSGGEMQRVALARALVMDPPVLLADEPTGALDSKAGAEVLELLALASRELGRTVVMVTHDAGAAARAERIIRLADGRVVER